MPVDNAQSLVRHLKRMPPQGVLLKSSLDTALKLAISIGAVGVGLGDYLWPDKPAPNAFIEPFNRTYR